MSKNSCSIVEAGQSQDGVLRKTVELFLGVWSGSEPSAMEAVAKPRLGPVLHRLPDLRKFGPNIR